MACRLATLGPTRSAGQRERAAVEAHLDRLRPPAGTRHESVSGTACPGLIVAILPIRRRSNFEPFTCIDHG